MFRKVFAASAVAALSMIGTESSADEAMHDQVVLDSYELQIDCNHNSADNENTKNNIVVEWYGKSGLLHTTKSNFAGGDFAPMYDIVNADRPNKKKSVLLRPTNSSPRCTNLVDAFFAYYWPKETVTRVRVKTSGNDGFLIDEVRLNRYKIETWLVTSDGGKSGYWKTKKNRTLVKKFGVDNAGATCLSTDPADANGAWRSLVKGCAKWVEFRVSTGKAYYPAGTKTQSSRKVANGQSCTGDSNCASGACARLTAKKGAGLACCPSGGSAKYAGYFYCTRMSNGSTCWSDAQCSSGNCKGNGHGIRRGTCRP